MNALLPIPREMVAGSALSDAQEAERFVTEAYDQDPAVSRYWLSQHRESLVRQATIAARQKREQRQWRARFSKDRDLLTRADLPAAEIDIVMNRKVMG